jgi:hypothetical protein
MNLSDVRRIAAAFWQSSPGFASEEVKNHWIDTVRSFAEEFGKVARSGMVNDHTFNDEVFVLTCMGQGQYALADEAEDERSWDMMFHDDSNGDERVWTSAIVLRKD